ncbi:MAG: DNA polymerase domain-containing protein [Acidimicrobiia bacterium]
MWTPPSDSELSALRALRGEGDWQLDGRVVHLTNLDKQMLPGRDGEAPLTKRDLIEYYARVAPWIGPYLWGRPVNLHRFPNGTEQPGFWNKAVPSHAPEWIRRWPSPFSSGAERDYFVLDGAVSLAWVANYGAFELHPWTSTAAVPDVPSFALIDIDPGPDTTWDETLVLARLFRTAIEHLGLIARPKVTGQRGVQIWIPVDGVGSFDDTRRLVVALSRTVGATVPTMGSWKWHKADRHGKARLDYTQNALNKTLVAPFSIRPAPGGPVSIPIEWDELDDDELRPDRWTARSVWERVSAHGDPFLAMIGVRQRLPEL